MSYTLSGFEAGSVASRGRQLLRRRAITAHQYALLDTMLWAARKPGSAMLIASLPMLARLAGQARSTVAQGIAALERLGLIQRIRRRIRVAWLGGQASRQIANAYRLLVPDTGSGARAARVQSPDSMLVVQADRQAAQEALAAVAARRAVALIA